MTCNFIKKRLQHKGFSFEYFEIFKNTFLEEHLQTATSKCVKNVYNESSVRDNLLPAFFTEKTICETQDE